MKKIVYKYKILCKYIYNVMYHKYMRLEGFDTMRTPKIQKMHDFKKIENIV